MGAAGRGHRRRGATARAAGVALPGLVIDIDASIVVRHSEKEQAAATFEHTFGYHPILAFCDNSGEFLAGLLRPGNAGANTAADHITVLDAALAQIPDAHRHGTPVLVRADGAGGRNPDRLPPGTRVLIRRERPHPGAQLDALEERDGWRYQCIATDTDLGQLAFLDARHRAHARVEDRIRCGKDTGLGCFPSARLDTTWPWAAQLAAAFTRCATLPQPAD